MSVVGYVVAAGIAIVFLPVSLLLLVVCPLTRLTPDAPDDDPPTASTRRGHSLCVPVLLDELLGVLYFGVGLPVGLLP